MSLSVTLKYTTPGGTASPACEETVICEMLGFSRALCSDIKDGNYSFRKYYSISLSFNFVPWPPLQLRIAVTAVITDFFTHTLSLQKGKLSQNSSIKRNFLLKEDRRHWIKFSLNCPIKTKVSKS